MEEPTIQQLNTEIENDNTEINNTLDKIEEALKKNADNLTKIIIYINTQLPKIKNPHAQRLLNQLSKNTLWQLDNIAEAHIDIKTETTNPDTKIYTLLFKEDDV